MESKVFKMINAGACAYFLIMYSGLTFLIELWYSSKESALLTAVSHLLMILIGILLLNKYRKALENSPDTESAAASAAGKLLGGTVILIIILQLVINQLAMFIARSNPEAFLGILFFLLIYTPFIIFAVLQVKKGLKIKAGQTFSGSIDFLCYRVILLYLFYSGLYHLMTWFQLIYMYPDISAMKLHLYWNFMPLASITAAMILYFAPLRIKNSIKDTDMVNYMYLSSQSYVTGGYLLLLTSLFKVLDQPAVMFPPDFILLIISILIIIYGNKRRTVY